MVPNASPSALTRGQHSSLKARSSLVSFAQGDFEFLARTLPEVAAKVGDNVAVFAFLHHEDLLLDDGEVISWKWEWR